MDDATISLLVLGAVVVLFVWNRLPVELVAVGAAFALYATGVLDLGQALAGFSDPTVVFIAALFVVSEGLDSSGVTAWAGQQLAGRATTERRLLLATMVLCAVLSAVIGINGAVAALLPMAVVMAVRQGILPSRLLMPLAFAGSAGALLLLTGSPVNVIVSDAAAAAGVGTFGYAEFLLVGIPAVAGTVLLVMAVGHRLVPERVSDSQPPDLSRHAGTIVTQYELGTIVHLRVTATSPRLGSPRAAWDPARFPGLRLLTVVAGDPPVPSDVGPVAVGDVLSVTGDEQVVARFAAAEGLEVAAVRTATEVEASILGRDTGVLEVVLPPRSRYVGLQVRTSQVVDGDLVVLGVRRRGRDLGSAPVRLEVGDGLLVEGPWPVLDLRARDNDVLVVDAPDLVRRQAVPLGAGSRRAIGVLAGLALLLMTGLVVPVVAALAAAGAMVLLGVVTVQQAYRGISWTTVLLIAGMIPMSTAIRTSGAGESVADLIVGAVGGAGPVVLLAALFGITVVFGQLISNTATALIMIPIGVSAAEQLDVSARPVLMSLCVASAVAFLTPVATPANMMVMGPAGYRFGDYWRLGLPLIGVFFVVSVLVVPLFWRF